MQGYVRDDAPKTNVTAAPKDKTIDLDAYRAQKSREGSS